MNRIASVFAQPNHKALIAYVTVGYPNLKATLELVPLLARTGCDMVELGIPFSDPLADGTTIQEAGHSALQGGVTPLSCLEVAQQLRSQVDVPLVFMSYYNPVLRFGLESFCRASTDAGVDGLIVPDLPPEEGTELEAAARQHKLDLIYLLAPTSTEERIQLVAQRSRGFIYLVSLRGITGPRETLPPGLDTFVARVRAKALQPLCVGFGISNAAQAAQVAQWTDGIIVGSRLIQLIGQDVPPYRLVEGFIKGLRKALDEVEKKRAE